MLDPRSIMISRSGGSKEQHVEPVCVDHLLAGGPLKDSEAPVL